MCSSSGCLKTCLYLFSTEPEKEVVYVDFTEEELNHNTSEKKENNWRQFSCCTIFHILHSQNILILAIIREAHFSKLSKHILLCAWLMNYFFIYRLICDRSHRPPVIINQDLMQRFVPYRWRENLLSTNFFSLSQYRRRDPSTLWCITMITRFAHWCKWFSVFPSTKNLIWCWYSGTGQFAILLEKTLRRTRFIYNNRPLQQQQHSLGLDVWWWEPPKGPASVVAFSGPKASGVINVLIHKRWHAGYDLLDQQTQTCGRKTSCGKFVKWDAAAAVVAGSVKLTPSCAELFSALIRFHYYETAAKGYSSLFKGKFFKNPIFHFMYNSAMLVYASCC